MDKLALIQLCRGSRVLLIRVPKTAREDTLLAASMRVHGSTSRSGPLHAGPGLSGILDGGWRRAQSSGGGGCQALVAGFP